MMIVYEMGLKNIKIYYPPSLESITALWNRYTFADGLIFCYNNIHIGILYVFVRCQYHRLK